MHLRPISLLLLAGLAFLAAGEAAPTVRTIAADQAIEQDLVVAAGERLEIKPGVTLTFAPDVGIIAEGQILAQGSAEKPIAFCAADALAGWGNVVLRGPQTAGSLFAHCSFTSGRGRTAVFDERLQITELKPASAEAAERQAGIGGALLLYACGEVKVLHCTFEANRAGWGGGAISCWGGAQATIMFNRFLGNSAGEDGGAIHCVAFSSPGICGNLFERNEAQYGGAIHCLQQSHAAISNNLIRDNRASKTAAAVSGYANSLPTLSGNLIVGNKAEEGTGAIAGGGGVGFRLFANHLARNLGKDGTGAGLAEGVVEHAPQKEAAVLATLTALGVPGTGTSAKAPAKPEAKPQPKPKPKP